MKANFGSLKVSFKRKLYLGHSERRERRGSKKAEYEKVNSFKAFKMELLKESQGWSHEVRILTLLLFVVVSKPEYTIHWPCRDHTSHC